MGAWGFGIMSDDSAADAREEYIELRGKGRSPAEAREEILAGRADSQTVTWLALAQTQWEHCELESCTLEEVLEIIESGSDLELWEEAGYKRQRAKVLDKFKAKLLAGPPRRCRKIPPYYVDRTPFRLGDVICYTSRKGPVIVMRVVGSRQEQGNLYSVVQLMDWEGVMPPTPEIAMRLPVLSLKNENLYSLVSFKEGEFPRQRVHVLVNDRHQVQIEPGGSGEQRQYVPYLFWVMIDDRLSCLHPRWLPLRSKRFERDCERADKRYGKTQESPAADSKAPDQPSALMKWLLEPHT